MLIHMYIYYAFFFIYSRYLKYTDYLQNKIIIRMFTHTNSDFSLCFGHVSLMVFLGEGVSNSTLQRAEIT